MIRCQRVLAALLGTIAAPAAAQLAAPTSSLLTVTNLADSGPGTLREALESARTDGLPTVIQFAVGGDILLQRDLPPIADMQNATTIDGSTAPSRIRIRTAPGASGTAMFVYSPNNVFRSFDLHDVDNDCLNLYETADDNLFEDVAVTNCRRGIGILIRGSDRNRFVRCRIENNYSAGIYCRDGSEGNQFGPGLRITGNANGGLHIRAGRGNTIAGTASEPNEFHSNGLFAIALFGGASQNVVGPDLRITGGSGFAVRITDPFTNGNVVQGVRVTNFSGPAFLIGIGAHSNTLWQCVADQPAGAGILVNGRASRNVIQECTVIGRAGVSGGVVSFTDAPNNRLLALVARGNGSGAALNPFGVALVNSPGCEISDGTFTNFLSHGIAINTGSDACLVQRNRVNGSGGRAPDLGIGVQGAAGTPVRGGLLDGNTLEDCPQSGVSIGESQDVVVTGNTVLRATNVGLRIQAGAQRIDLLDNAVLATGTAPIGINLFGAQNVRMIGNTVRDFTTGVEAVRHTGGLVCDRNRFLACSRIALNLGAATATVTNNLFDANDVGTNVDNTVVPAIQIVNNTFVHNRVGHQGGGEVWNNVFWFNVLDVTLVTFQYANLRHNAVQAGNPLIGTNGNLFSVPSFVSGTSLIGDFHLRNTSSPLIHAGSSTAPGLPTLDVDGQSRMMGTGPDLGMDEVR